MTDRQLILDFLKANPGVKCAHHVQPAIDVYYFWSEGGGPQLELAQKIGALHPTLRRRAEVRVYPVEFSPGEVLEVT